MSEFDEKAVFHCIANCEVSTYTTMYPPQRSVNPHHQRMGMQLQNKAFKAKNGRAYTNCGVVQWKNGLTEQQQRIIFTAEKERANE